MEVRERDSEEAIDVCKMSILFGMNYEAYTLPKLTDILCAARADDKLHKLAYF